MDMSSIHNVEHEVKLKMKIKPIQPLEVNPIVALFIIPDRVLCLKNIGNYLRSNLKQQVREE